MKHCFNSILVVSSLLFLSLLFSPITQSEVVSLYGIENLKFSFSDTENKEKKESPKEEREEEEEEETEERRENENNNFVFLYNKIQEVRDGRHELKTQMSILSKLSFQKESLTCVPLFILYTCLRVHC